MPPDATRAPAPTSTPTLIPSHLCTLFTLSPFVPRHRQVQRARTARHPFHRFTARPHRALTAQHRTHRPASTAVSTHATGQDSPTCNNSARPWLTYALTSHTPLRYLLWLLTFLHSTGHAARHGFGACRARASGTARPARATQRRQVGVVVFFVVAHRAPTIGALCPPQWRLAFKGSVAVKRRAQVRPTRHRGGSPASHAGLDCPPGRVYPGHTSSALTPETATTANLPRP